MAERGKQIAGGLLVLGVFLASWLWGRHLECLPHSPGALPARNAAVGEGGEPRCYSIEISHEYRSYSLPDAERLKAYTLGFSKMVADLMFVNVVGNLTWKEREPAFLDWVYKMGLAISALHPQYSHVYYSIGTFLSFRKLYIEESNDIFRRGMEALPLDFNMPFYIAYNYYWELGEKQAAEPYFREACQRPTAPPHMCTLAGRLLAERDTNPYDIATLIAAGYCVNASDERAHIIRHDFNKHVLPLLENDVKREKLSAWFDKQIEECREQTEDL